MKRRPVHQIRRNATVHVLTATPRGLAWRSFSISRTTPRSVFVSTPLGEVQLPRQELERRGRVDVAGEVFSLHRFALPRDGPPGNAQPDMDQITTTRKAIAR